MKINDMTREELVQYLFDFVEALERSNDLSELSGEERDFISLQKKIINELLHDRVYKVSTAGFSGRSSIGLMERDIRYFSSLKAAKKEVKRRMEELVKNPFVAGPDEVQTLGLEGGFAPDLIDSVITNSDITVKAPGRFKFYEVRMVKNGEIFPVQFILTNVHVSPSGFQDVGSPQPGRPANEQHVAKIIPFDQIGRSSL